MGDHRQYHHGAPGAMGGHGDVGGASMGSKQQEGYQYRGGLGDSLGVQYDHCPTEQRFQVEKNQAVCQYVLKNVYLNIVEEQLLNYI